MSINSEFDSSGGSVKYPICPVREGFVRITWDTEMLDGDGAEYLPGIGHLEFIQSLEPLNPLSADGEADDGAHIANAMHLVGADWDSEYFDENAACAGGFFWIKRFEIREEFRGMGLAYPALHAALMAIGAQEKPVFAYPAKSNEGSTRPGFVPSFSDHDFLVKFWLGMDIGAQYIKDENVVAVGCYNLNGSVAKQHSAGT